MNFTYKQKTTISEDALPLSTAWTTFSSIMTDHHWGTPYHAFVTTKILVVSPTMTPNQSAISRFWNETKTKCNNEEDCTKFCLKSLENSEKWKLALFIPTVLVSFTLVLLVLIGQLYQWLIRRRRERRYHDPDETEKPVSVSDASEEGSDTSGSSTRSKSPLSLPRPPRNVPVLPISENMAASTSLKRKALIQSKKPQPQTSDQHQSTTATNSAEHPVLPKDNASSDHVDAAGNPADPPQQPRRGTTGLKDFLGRSVRFTTSTKGSWG